MVAGAGAIFRASHPHPVQVAGILTASRLQGSVNLTRSGISIITGILAGRSSRMWNARSVAVRLRRDLTAAMEVVDPGRPSMVGAVAQGPALMAAAVVVADLPVVVEMAEATAVAVAAEGADDKFYGRLAYSVLKSVSSNFDCLSKHFFNWHLCTGKIMSFLPGR
jgi:hypothetical protein